MLQVTSHLLQDIKAGQQLAEDLVNIKEKIDDPKYKSFRLDHSNTLWFGKRLVVPNQENLKKQILNEAHESLFSIHPRSNKIDRDVRKRFWWKGLKQDIARFVAECDVCCRVKAECRVHKPRVPRGPASTPRLGPEERPFLLLDRPKSLNSIDQSTRFRPRPPSAHLSDWSASSGSSRLRTASPVGALASGPGHLRTASTRKA